MIECSWTAFGMLFGIHLASLGGLLESLVPSKALLGLLLEALGRVLEAPRSCLGGPKRSRELHLEAQSAPRRQLGGPKPSEEPILEASSSLTCQFGDPLPCEELNLEELSS